MPSSAKKKKNIFGTQFYLHGFFSVLNPGEYTIFFSFPTLIWLLINRSYFNMYTVFTIYKPFENHVFIYILMFSDFLKRFVKLFNYINTIRIDTVGGQGRTRLRNTGLFLVKIFFTSVYFLALSSSTLMSLHGRAQILQQWKAGIVSRLWKKNNV